jgi:hypothetical protein
MLSALGSRWQKMLREVGRYPVMRATEGDLIGDPNENLFGI